MSEKSRPLEGKVIIKGKLKCVTGLHIGAGRESMEIGDIDNPVMRDPITKYPYIPGSSFKGKMRCLLERNKGRPLVEVVRGKIFRHECGDLECEICRLFGSSYDKNSTIPARTIFRDIMLTEESAAELKKMDTGLNMTEWKFENNIDRITSKADPRNLERIPAGSVFSFEVVYDIVNPGHTQCDLDNLFSGMKLLEDDYMGGNGSRGYGKVSFEIDNVILKKKEEYAKGIPIQVQEDWAKISSSIAEKIK